MRLAYVQIVSVPVADQDRAKSFYVDTLGFELVSDNPFAHGQRWVQVRPPGAQTSLTLVTWFPTMPAGSLQGLVLLTDDLDEAYRELAEKGVQFSGPIEPAPWGRFATFADPDGNGWVLQTPPTQQA